jgi:hypothetical protein
MRDSQFGCIKFACNRGRGLDAPPMHGRLEGRAEPVAQPATFFEDRGVAGFAFQKPLDEEMKEEFKLPSSYYLDESDPDILVLRRQDGSFVAAFSASGATKEGIWEAAMEDYRALIEAHRVKHTE